MTMKPLSHDASVINTSMSNRSHPFQRTYQFEAVVGFSFIGNQRINSSRPSGPETHVSANTCSSKTYLLLETRIQVAPHSTVVGDLGEDVGADSARRARRVAPARDWKSRLQRRLFSVLTFTTVEWGPTDR